MHNAPLLLEPDLLRLTKSLRSEAKALKDCFTRYSIFGIFISANILGGVTPFVWEKPQLGLACIASLTIVLTISRLGTFKYGAANRLLGYELYLYHTRRFLQNPQGGWKREWRYIGWEEALRAWRIVQATLFVQIYWPSSVGINRLRSSLRKHEVLWFRQKSQGKDNIRFSYYAGSYLRSMMGLLHCLAGASFIPLGLMTYRIGKESGNNIWFILALAISLLALGLTICMVIRDWVRVRILEDGLLSIHSCSIVWQAVVLAHFSALTGTEQEYIANLATEASTVAEKPEDIYEWIKSKVENLRGDTPPQTSGINPQ